MTTEFNDATLPAEHNAAATSATLNDNRQPVPRLWIVGFAVLSWWLAMVAPASAANMTVTPSSVVGGGTVTVSGVAPVPGCPVPGTVMLISDAFAGTGAVNVPVDAGGHFSARITLRAIAPGTYGVLGRCGGGEFGGPFPAVTVTGLPRTGGSLGPLSDATATGIGLALIAAGFAALIVAGRRRHSVTT
jgi:hypothetical protein